MAKSLLFGLAALGTSGVAVLAFLNDRIVIPFVLVVASICFIIAAVGAAKQRPRVE